MIVMQFCLTLRRNRMKSGYHFIIAITAFCLFALSSVSAQIDASKMEDKQIGAAISAEVEKLAKECPKYLANSLPKYDNSWNIYVLAEQDIYNDNLDVGNKSVVYVGQNFTSRRITIKGDGIVYIDGVLSVPDIRIKGKGAVVYETSGNEYYGSRIVLGSGFVSSEKDNHSDIYIQGEGMVNVGRNNNGDTEIMGVAAVKVGGDQNGGIVFGKGSGAFLDIGGRLARGLNVSQSLTLNMKGDVEDDIFVDGDLKLTCGAIRGANIETTGHATVVCVFTETLGQETSFRSKSSELSIARGNEMPVYAKDSIKLVIGGMHQGDVVSENASIDINVVGQSRGKIKANQNIVLKANGHDGDIDAGQNVTANITQLLVCDNFRAGKNATVRTATFQGGMLIGETGDIQANIFQAGMLNFEIEMKNGQVISESLCESRVKFLQNGTLKVNGDMMRPVYAGGNLDLQVAGDMHKKIFVGNVAKISVAKAQRGLVTVRGTLSEASFGTLLRSVYVKGTANIKTTFTGKNPKDYDDYEIRMASGTIEVQEDNVFKLIAQDPKGTLNASIGKSNNAGIDAKGILTLQIGYSQIGDIVVGNTASLNIGGDCLGNIRTGQDCNISISEVFSGDLVVGENSKVSMIKLNAVHDANIDIAGAANINATEILSNKPGKEFIRIKTGVVKVENDIYSDVVILGEGTVRAKNIFGNVNIASPSSQVEALINGRMNVMQ